MSIRDWPEGERPREKLLTLGAEALSDAELLAIFLRVGVAGRSAVDLARDLLTAFGGLRQLLEADQTRFCAERGLGTAKFVQLQATLELSKRHLAAQLARGNALTSPPWCAPTWPPSFATWATRSSPRCFSIPSTA